MARLINMIGIRYGRLVCIEQVESAFWGSAATKEPRYRFKCDCGARVTKWGRAVRKGQVQSCGCLRREVALVNIAKGRVMAATARAKQLILTGPQLPKEKA